MRYLLLIAFLLALTNLSFALTPFGGKILEITKCCFGSMIKIEKYSRSWPGGPPTLKNVETFMFIPGISHLIVGNLTPGKWSLGSAFPRGFCLMRKGRHPCGRVVPTNYTIYFIGTSISPSF